MKEFIADSIRFMLGPDFDEQLVRASIIGAFLRAAFTKGTIASKVLAIASSFFVAHFTTMFFVKRFELEEEARTAVGFFIAVIGYEGFKWLIDWIFHKVFEKWILEKVDIGSIIQNFLPKKNP